MWTTAIVFFLHFREIEEIWITAFLGDNINFLWIEASMTKI